MRLVLVRDAEQAGLGEVRADELQARRQLPIALADEAARDRHRRESGEVRADRVDVVQVHRIGSLVLAPSSNAAVGVVGPITTSTSAKARAKSAAMSCRTFCALR